MKEHDNATAGMRRSKAKEQNRLYGPHVSKAWMGATWRYRIAVPTFDARLAVCLKFTSSFLHPAIFVRRGLGPNLDK
jgi:hypothetical protein